MLVQKLIVNNLGYLMSTPLPPDFYCVMLTVYKRRIEMCNKILGIFAQMLVLQAPCSGPVGLDNAL
jgi:hypothetical protein